MTRRLKGLGLGNIVKYKKHTRKIKKAKHYFPLDVSVKNIESPSTARPPILNTIMK